jgi:S-DNA-T family DNA segregation ATPase FtsK/SpoIIIE
MLLSILYRFPPEDLRLILVDPKVVEFNIYNRLPHLIVPVVNNVEPVVAALGWVVHEMERRYRLLAVAGVRNLDDFNHRPPKAPPPHDDRGQPLPPKLPYIVVVIDELADLILTAREAIEQKLARIAQMSRAVGIHTIIATQRPSVNVVTGVIKANYPTRIAFQVSSQTDARTILDNKGAESLLGRGDMLFRPPGADRLQRLQGPMVEDGEIERVVEFVGRQASPDFDLEILKPPSDSTAAVEVGESVAAEDETVIQQALEVILEGRRATTSYVQRRLRIGYNRAALVMEILEQRGLIGPQIGTAPREILVDGGGQPGAVTETEDEDAAN